jgi:REP element-mobilizing transposase RayT
MSPEGDVAYHKSLFPRIKNNFYIYLMPTKTTIPFNCGTFFITFSCFNWINLIEIVNGYDIVYNWFDYLKKQNHYINGFVIMPNHLHAIISFRESENINITIGNGKRFMAYEIVKRLKQNNEVDLLNLLNNSVEKKRKAKNKQHEIWNLSFDWKHCSTRDFIEQKLIYIHNNPCSKKWNLSAHPSQYIHSSAFYYIENKEGFYPVTNFMLMEDINLTNTFYSK